MADRMMEVDRLSSSTVAPVSQPITMSTSDLAELMTQIIQLSATVAALQLRRSAGLSRRSVRRDRHRSRPRPRIANLCWYNVNYGDNAPHCVPSCFFKSTQGFSSAGGSSDRSNDIRPIPQKVAAIRNFPRPTLKRQLQRFLDMENFYRRFLPNCADTILPLTSLLVDSKRTFELIPAVFTPFEQVKALLADATLLTHFHADATISLMADASSVAVGAVLQQSLLDSAVPLVFFSRKLPKSETHYSTFGREPLVV
nr:unnamed protein product [Spirometra erinaceieuropaei]